MLKPRLRTVEKREPPYRLNQFPPNFDIKLGRELICHLATSGSSLEGSQWEAIFARVIGAQWKPSNVGLDDVVLGNCAWGAKTVKAACPATVSKVRLISGRNSPIFSFGSTDVRSMAENELGRQILSIYNKRVWSVRSRFEHLRTVVLVKSDDLLEAAAFEFETVAYDEKEHVWRWNKNGNLEGCDRSGAHCFTWQPHGSQFTIVETVPPERLAIRIRRPGPLPPERILEQIGYDDTWVQRAPQQASLFPAASLPGDGNNR